jgi:hypothetical protein
MVEVINQPLGFKMLSADFKIDSGSGTCSSISIQIITSNFSKFGFLSDLTKYPQYLYTDLNGNIVNVSSVSSGYDETKNNVAVFNYNNRLMGPIVEQSEFRIVNNNERLITSGLFTCCGLSIIIGNKKFFSPIGCLPMSSES